MPLHDNAPEIYRQIYTIDGVRAVTVLTLQNVGQGLLALHY